MFGETSGQIQISSRMDLIKTSGLAFLLFLSVMPSQFVRSQGIVHFKLFKCTFNDEFIVPNSTCFAKAYNRTTSTINEFIYLKKPCSDFSVSLNKKPKEVLSNFYSRWKLPFPSSTERSTAKF